MKSIYFASFYFRVFNSIREIRENKNLAKISTYTVLQIRTANLQEFLQNPENSHAWYKEYFWSWDQQIV